MSESSLKPGDVVRVLQTGMRAMVIAVVDGYVKVRPVSGRVFTFRERELQKAPAESDRGSA